MAGAIVLFFMLFGALIVVLGWTGFSIYALVKWIGSAPEEANPAAVILLFVCVVTVLTTGLLAGLSLVGRSMTPRKRGREPRGDEEIPGL